jgi:protein-S-isoprenylcysteine O-methyltransferase Ste14
MARPPSALRLLAVLTLAVLVPILLAFLIPAQIVAATPPAWTVDVGAIRFLAPMAWTAGAATALWAATMFVVVGRGTPTSAAPPRDLVVQGLYRWVRNPMYVGGLLVVLGHLLWSGALTLLLYLAALFALFHAFIVLYEEPRLRGRFGAAYGRYARHVPRWIPRIPGGRNA